MRRSQLLTSCSCFIILTQWLFVQDPYTDVYLLWWDQVSTWNLYKFLINKFPWKCKSLQLFLESNLIDEISLHGVFRRTYTRNIRVFFMEIGALMFSMEFHGKCPNPSCKYFPWKSMEKFPWNSMKIDVLIIHGIPWRIFHGNPRNSMEFHGGFSHGIPSPAVTVMCMTRKIAFPDTL